MLYTHHGSHRPGQTLVGRNHTTLLKYLSAFWVQRNIVISIALNKRDDKAPCHRDRGLIVTAYTTENCCMIAAIKRNFLRATQA
jgi:hypothetical protein